MKRLAAFLAKGALGLVLGSVVWVLAVRWIDPPLTWTMVGRMMERREAGEPWAVRMEPLSLEALGDPVARAVVASEDGLFWVHRGFDWSAVCDAIRHNAEGGRLRGASTISQQVARNVFLWQGRSWVRKGLEVWFTLWLELLLPKERILELYLNVAETGPETFGFEAGSRFWFGKGAASLSLEEAGRLAGLLPNPVARSVHGDEAAARADFVVRNQVPFPGERGFESAVSTWRGAPWPWECAGY